MLKIYRSSFALSLILSGFSSAEAKHSCSSHFCHDVVGKECMKACKAEFPHDKKKCGKVCKHVGDTCSGKPE